MFKLLYVDRLMNRGPSKASGESPEMKRLRRVMQPRADGTYIVPQEIVDKWADTAGGGRNLVISLWNQSETNKAM